MGHPQEKIIAPEEYFQMEEVSEYKSEYYHGETFAMSGASVNHNLIISDVITSLNTALRKTNCLVFPSDIKVELDRGEHYVYPDVSIVCGDIRYGADRKDIITNPVVIIEVLSESTKDYDRGTKFKAYRKISSLRDYILIDQYNHHVEYFFKNESGQWILEEFHDTNDSFIIRSVNVELSLDNIYYRVKA
ncbi:MAG: Uma2 family endonuclease [Desulfobacterales bacterium]|nr:Uma2 family endonuclease [Desulfobacterales bacterium]